jgi:mannose-6-phosphate isomerase
MTLERTITRNVPKQWGSTDLRPWCAHHDGEAIGEIWFQRAQPQTTESALLLKMIFTEQPLSIQVHPDDAYAHSIGLPNGKCEAWYILAAGSSARIALGLKRPVSAGELRGSIHSGSVAELVQWRGVKPGEAILVSAGTIHSMGSGIVAVEIQQRSDTTFRLFDFGRDRELHPDHAVAAAQGDRVTRQATTQALSTERTLLVTDRHFVLERAQLAPGSDWELCASSETWLFVLEGRCWVGELDACRGEAIFLEGDSARIRVRSEGMQCLLAYVGAEANPSLLRGVGDESAGIPRSDQEHSFLQPDLAVTFEDAAVPA